MLLFINNLETFIQNGGGPFLFLQERMNDRIMVTQLATMPPQTMLFKRIAVTIFWN